MTITPEELDLLDALNQIPATPAQRPPVDADHEEILDFYKRRREVDLFAQLGDCSSAPGQRYVALVMPGEYIRTLDHVYGPGDGLRRLAERFRLDPIAHFDATRLEGQVVLLLAEKDAQRLGDTTFVAKANSALREAVEAIERVDAERSLPGMDQDTKLILIKAGALGKGHAQGLSGARRDRLMACDLGL